MPPGWVPFALLVVTFLGEMRTWRDYRARSAPSAQDAGSFRLNNVLGWLAIGSGIASTVAVRDGGTLALHTWLAWAGIPLSLAGTALRAWAVAALGRWFTLTIQVRPEQPVIQSGPFRWIRHPSYAGGELALLGVGFSAGNWLAPICFVLPWLVAHVYRIRVEERALLGTLGESYRAYRERTWRLVPFLW